MQNKGGRPGFLAKSATLIAFLLSVTGCAAPSVPPAPSSPQLPSKPSVSTPQPQQTYSSSALLDIQKWRKQLTDTPLTP